MAKTTHINKSQIMKRAWAIYRAEPWFTNYTGRARFGLCLTRAWEEHHAEQARAFYAAQAVEQAGMARLDRVKWQVAMLQYKSSRYNIGAEREHLEAEIRELAA